MIHPCSFWPCCKPGFKNILCSWYFGEINFGFHFDALCTCSMTHAHQIAKFKLAKIYTIVSSNMIFVANVQIGHNLLKALLAIYPTFYHARLVLLNWLYILPYLLPFDQSDCLFGGSLFLIYNCLTTYKTYQTSFWCTSNGEPAIFELAVLRVWKLTGMV